MPTLWTPAVAVTEFVLLDLLFAQHSPQGRSFLSSRLSSLMLVARVLLSFWVFFKSFYFGKGLGGAAIWRSMSLGRALST